MPAPSGIIWGDSVGTGGRIGIYVGLSSTDTTTSVTIEVWFWSKYSVSDSHQAYYFGNETTAKYPTARPSLVINHTVSTGSGWDTSNQTKMGTYTYSYTRTSSAQTIYCSATLKSVEAIGDTMTCVRSYTIPALPVYTISYNANGGYGAPTSQTKNYNVAITLSSTIPTRANYNFIGWATSSTATTATYNAGASYTSNASVTLYAVWKSAYSNPRIINLAVRRCDSSGTANEDGTYFKLYFVWETDLSVSSISAKWKTASDSSWESTTISASGTSGTITEVLGGDSISIESTYNVQVIVSDGTGSTTLNKTLPGKAYTIDFLSGGKGVAIGKPAENEGFEVAMVSDFNAYTKLNNTINTVGYYRFNTQWIGLYGSCSNAQANTNRKGWIGFDGTTNFYLINQSGGSNMTNVAWTTSSDERLKKDIEDAPNVFIDIWKELHPKIFKWNELNGNDSKIHFGLIAQDVIDTFDKYNLDYRDYGFVNTFTMQDGNTEYFGIAYDEYHIITSVVLKETISKIDNLQAQIDELKSLIIKEE